jgi:hypothetical protein
VWRSLQLPQFAYITYKLLSLFANIRQLDVPLQLRIYTRSGEMESRTISLKTCHSPTALAATQTSAADVRKNRQNRQKGPLHSLEEFMPMPLDDVDIYISVKLHTLCEKCKVIRSWLKSIRFQ